MRTREELAWAAGFYDGEGCAHLAKQSKGSRMPQLCVVQTRDELLHRLSRIFGFGSVTKHSRSTTYSTAPGVQLYRWQIYGFQKVQATIAMMWPWLSEYRRSQAEGVLRGYQEYHATLKYPKRSRALAASQARRSAAKFNAFYT
jgi:hypothetical protein